MVVPRAKTALMKPPRVAKADTPVTVTVNTEAARVDKDRMYACIATIFSGFTQSDIYIIIPAIDQIHLFVLGLFCIIDRMKT